MHSAIFFLQLNIRNVNFYDWGTYLMIFCFLIIVFVYTYQGQRFLAMMRLPISDKYLRVFDEQPLNSIFNGLNFLLKIISFAFVAYFVLLKFQLTQAVGFNLFLQLFTAIFVYYVAKIIFEKMLFNIFDIEYLFEKIHYSRFSYSNAIGLLLLPIHFIIFYNFDLPNVVFYIYFGLIVIGILFNYFISLVQFFKLLLKHHIYFILYICTLEIAPLVFIYQLFTNSSIF